MLPGDSSKMYNIPLDRAYLIALWLETYLFGGFGPVSRAPAGLILVICVNRCIYDNFFYSTVSTVMETSQRSLLEARRPAHRAVHLSDVSPTRMVRGMRLTVLHSRTHAIIVLIRTIQGFIGRGNQELGGATEYFLEASSPLNVYAPLCPLHTMAVLIFSSIVRIYSSTQRMWVLPASRLVTR